VSALLDAQDAYLLSIGAACWRSRPDEGRDVAARLLLPGT